MARGAGRRTEGGVYPFSASSSSVNKGESLRDTVETLDAMGIDAVVVRHRSSGVPWQIARWTRAAIVNAGDGWHEHPTQALLDAYTILGVLVVGVMIPAGPGMVGTFQAAIVGGLSLFEPGAGERAFAFANVMWLVQLTQQIVLGTIFLFSRHIQLARAFEARDEAREEAAEGLDP